MKKILNFLLLPILLFSCGKKETLHDQIVINHQYKLNSQYADKENSPLTEEGLATFKAHEFFDIDENYVVEASFELTPDEPIFEMKTTTDRLPLYRKYGIARFELEGMKMELSIYQNQKYIDDPVYGDHLFLPFNDKTNGSSSYGGGRYIDLEIPEKGANSIVIDFNLSYNPYCAYNKKYSCPIPPKENRLAVSIPVGIKTYKKK